MRVTPLKTVRVVALLMFSSGCASLFGGAPAVKSLTDGTAVVRAAGPLELTVGRFKSDAKYEASSDRGHVVLIDVWATWCEACREVFPQYEELQKRFSDKGLKVYALSVDADANAVAQFVTETKLQLPVLMDPEAHIAESVLKVKLMPTSFIIDRKGVIRFTHEGLSDELLATEAKEVELLLAEP